MRDERCYEPDAVFGRRVRFICGAVLGLMLGLWLHLHIGPFNLVLTVVVAIVSAAACGVLAMRYGDAFWRSVISALRW